MNLTFNDYMNIAITLIFVVISVPLIFRMMKLKGKVMIKDQQWSTLRIMFLAIGLLSFLSLLTGGQSMTLFDFARLGATIIAVTVFMMMRDGVGEEGLVSGGKFIPWTEVRSYDYEERKNVTAVYFTVESQDEKKPDDYRTKELDFSKEDHEYLMKFLEMNLGRKYTRMKKKRA